MQINYTVDALASLIQLVNFIESKNTPGAGLRWLGRYEAFLQKQLYNSNHSRPCNNQTFRKLNLYCINYNDWLIAFSLQTNAVLIEAVLHKSRITD